MSTGIQRAEAIKAAIGGGGAIPALAGYCHARAYLIGRRFAARLSEQRGQGTVEYVGLILLVSLLMVGMVAAMKGFDRRHTLDPHRLDGWDSPRHA